MTKSRDLGDLANGTFTGDFDVTGSITVSGTVDGVDIATNIPSSLGTAGQVLTVNSGATAGEWADAGGASAATTPTLSGDSALTTFINTYTLTISNYNSYTVPIFFYTIVNNGGTITATGNFTTSSLDIPSTQFDGTGPFTIKVIAGDVSSAFSAAATKSVSDVSGISARYWRIGVTPNEGIGEWRLYSGRNTAGTDFSVSSYLGSYAGASASYARDKAHDGSQTTMWWSYGGTTGQGSNTLIFDLGSNQTVKSMSFVNTSASYALGVFTTAGCTVASSTDNVTYTNRLTGVVTNDASYLTLDTPKIFGK